MWRTAARLVTVGTLLMAVLGLAAQGAGATEPSPAGVAAAFTTTEVAIGAGVDRAVVLRLTNGTTAPATDVVLALVADPGIEILDRSAAPSTLAPGASVALVLDVSRANEAPGTASVHAVVRYVTGTGAGAVAGAAVATLTVTDAPVPAAPAAPLTITPSNDAVALVQYQSVDVFFTVASTSGHAQQVTSAIVSYPSFLAVTAPAPDGTRIEGRDGTLVLPSLRAVGAGDAAVVHLRLDASGPVQPGSGLVLLTVAAQDLTSGTTTTTSASQQITFSVLGESGMLTLLGVPSLLFVPGLVFVLVLWALWRYVLPRAALASPGAEPGGKLFLWVFALLPTLALPFLYPAVTQVVLGQRRDYRRVYGLDDILYVWMLAAALAVLAWGVVLVARAIRRSVFLPAPGLSELRLLSVFAVRLWNRSLSRPSYVHGGTQPVVLLGHRDGQVLVTPLISYSTAQLGSAEIERLADGGLIPGKPLRTWWFFLRRRASAPLTYQAGPSDGLLGPTLVAEAALTRQATALPLVVPQT